MNSSLFTVRFSYPMIMDFIKQFTHELTQANPQPERLALAIAGLAYPTLDLQKYLGQLDEMAEIARRTLFDTAPGEERARHFLRIINQELGFTGNREHYYDPNNSFLNVVLEQRTGLPIMLSLVCIAIGRRLQMNIEGIGFPGHFMAYYTDEAGAWLLDPFNSEVLDRTEAADYLSRIFAQPIQLTPDVYEAVTAGALAQRILNNLRGIYLSQRNFGMAARVIDYMLIFAPLDATAWRERGLLHHYNDQWDAALHDLRRYFFLAGQSGLTLGLEKNEATNSATLAPQDRQLLDIFHKIEETRRRSN